MTNKKPLVLIVDDEPDFAWLLSQFLEHKGLEVRTVETGEEGLDAVKTTEPQLVLLDVNLPDRSGVELVPAIRNLNPIVPIVMISGNGDSRLVVSSIKLGATDYVQKPFDHAMLWTKIEGHIRMPVGD